MARVVYGAIEIELRRPTNSDAFRRETIVDRLTERLSAGQSKEISKGQMGYIVLFARLVSQARTSKNVPFKVSIHPSNKEIDDGFDIFMEMDEEFGNACWAAMLDLEKVADPDIAPDPPAKDADPNSLSAAPKSKKRGATGGRG